MITFVDSKDFHPTVAPSYARPPPPPERRGGVAARTSRAREELETRRHAGGCWEWQGKHARQATMPAAPGQLNSVSAKLFTQAGPGEPRQVDIGRDYSNELRMMENHASKTMKDHKIMVSVTRLQP